MLFSPPEDNTITSWYWEIGTSYYTDASPFHTFKSPADYPLYLEVTATNGCTSSVRDVIHIPVPLTPAFSAVKNCVGEEAVLEDMTKGDDPVTSQEWSFDSGEAFTGSPVMFIFQEQATRTITLKVTAESGCSYAASKQIKILLPPVAGFAAEPASGAYPLEVKFGNTSSGATEYSWKFDDGSVSSETSPIHIFSGPGSYNVELTALNDLGCDAVFVANIGAVAPLPDVDIEMISLTPNGDGSMKLIVTLNNNGNTVLRDLPLELDFGGTHFTHILEGPIAPMSKFNFVFGTAVGGAPSIDYICVSADLADDLSPAGNRRCAELADKLFVFPAFPNPAADQLNVEWLAPETGSLRISVMDVLGRMALDVDAATVAGLNRHTIDVSGLGNGIYYLMLRQGDVSEVQRIAVSGRR